jgi:hypothetical protein
MFSLSLIFGNGDAYGGTKSVHYFPLLLPVTLSLGDVPAPVVLLPGVPEPAISPVRGVGSAPALLGSAIPVPELPADIPVLPPAVAPLLVAAP